MTLLMMVMEKMVPSPANQMIKLSLWSMVMCELRSQPKALIRVVIMLIFLKYELFCLYKGEKRKAPRHCL